MPAPGKLTVPELAEMKRRGDPIVMVTAYDATGGRLADAAGVELILVGDTAAMVVLGHESSTVPVTMDEMLFMTRAVTRGARRPLVVGDMPFGSYQVSDEDAVRNAIRFVKEAGADVQARGRRRVPTRVWSTSAPDRRDGPYRVDAAVRHDARRLQDARAKRRDGLRPTRRACARGSLLRTCSGGSGAAAEDITAARRSRRSARRRRELRRPGAVWHDLLGLYEGHTPRFVKQYAQLGEEIRRALGEYVEDVRARSSPPGAHLLDAVGGARRPGLRSARAPRCRLQKREDHALATNTRPPGRSRPRAASSPRGRPDRAARARPPQVDPDPAGRAHASAPVRAAVAEHVVAEAREPHRPDGEQEDERTART